MHYRTVAGKSCDWGQLRTQRLNGFHASSPRLMVGKQRRETSSVTVTPPRFGQDIGCRPQVTVTRHRQAVELPPAGPQALLSRGCEVCDDRAPRIGNERLHTLPFVYDRPRIVRTQDRDEERRHEENREGPARVRSREERGREEEEERGDRQAALASTAAKAL